MDPVRIFSTPVRPAATRPMPTEHPGVLSARRPTDTEEHAPSPRGDAAVLTLERVVLARREA